MYMYIYTYMHHSIAPPPVCIAPGHYDRIRASLAMPAPGGAQLGVPG